MEHKPNGAPRSIDQFSPREHEVTKLIMDGKTDVEIGIILGVSPRTVRFHAVNAMEKCKVCKRVQLAIIYDRQMNGRVPEVAIDPTVLKEFLVAE